MFLVVIIEYFYNFKHALSTIYLSVGGGFYVPGYVQL